MRRPWSDRGSARADPLVAGLVGLVSVGATVGSSTARMNDVGDGGLDGRDTSRLLTDEPLPRDAVGSRAPCRRCGGGSTRSPARRPSAT